MNVEMSWVEVRDEAGNVVWRSPEVALLGVDRVENTVRILDMDESLVVAAYNLKPGETVVSVHPEAAAQSSNAEV